MSDLHYVITIEVKKPIGQMDFIGPVTVAKISGRGRLYSGKNAAEQLREVCFDLLGSIEVQLQKAARRP
jgi:hypothetical protein